MRVDPSYNGDRGNHRRDNRGFEGLEPALKEILQVGPYLGYFILRDFCIDGAQQPLESVDFEPDPLASFLLPTPRQYTLQAEIGDGEPLELDEELFSEAHNGEDSEPADGAIPPTSDAPGTSPIAEAPLECDHAMLLGT